jgi:hypothetical protein
MSCIIYIVCAYDVIVMTKKSTKFSHKAVKFKRRDNECNVVVSKEFKYMRMTADRRKANTARNTQTLFHEIFKLQEYPQAKTKCRKLDICVCLFVFLELQPIVVVFSQPGSGL